MEHPYAPPRAAVQDVVGPSGTLVPAEKMLGVQVVRKGGAPVSAGRIFWLRNVINGLLGIIPLYAFVDRLFIFGKSRQRLHDMIADTIVVVA
jgi:uncharacterized RDD family membrane protein YckC